VEDAYSLQDAGCFSLVLEAVPEAVAQFITQQIKIPKIGIGAGPSCSGQVLVQLDALGCYEKLSPKFSKVFGNIGQASVEALKKFQKMEKMDVDGIPGPDVYERMVELGLRGNFFQRLLSKFGLY
jgi:3-methyl-2-oxobutanoate hydroxymethyltransferase